MPVEGITTDRIFTTPDRTRFNDVNRELANLRRQLFSRELSDTERTAVQTLIRQAEHALNGGKANIARQFINQASKTFEEPADQNLPQEKANPKSAPNIQTPEIEERTYQDVSNDPSVSFKYPQKLNEYQAGIAIRAHEGEHVRDAIFKAQNKGVLARVQVRFHTGIDRKGRRFLKGGTTKVTFRKKGKFKKVNQSLKLKINIHA